MSIIYNNLCPKCLEEHQQGIDIKHKTARIKIYPEQDDSPLILVCIHPEGSSILDLGECFGCRKTGIVAAPEDQRGTHVYRDVNFVSLEIDVSKEIGTCYCSDCNVKKVCDVCKNEKHQVTEKNVNGKLINICRECAYDIKKCSICGETHTYYNEKYDRFICPTCVKKVTLCPTCSALLPSKESFVLFGDSFGCPNCITVERCAYCNERTNTRYISNTGYICGEHYPLVNNLPTVGGYHHTKVTKFHKTSNEKNTNIFFGIENEVQLMLSEANPPSNLQIRRRILTKEALSLFPDVDCKRDGSLSYTFKRQSYDAGVEIVWQPMTWGSFKEQKPLFKELFNKITPMLRKNMAQAGMHIHISKEAFSPLHFLKLTNFFYMQEKADFLRVIAGRGPNSYASVSAGYSLDGKRHGVQYRGRALAYHEIAKKKADNTKMKYARTYRSYSDRYDCINITNENTYEIRIFKGARTYDEFIRRFTFVHSIYEYTRTVSRKDMSLVDYFNFVKKNKKEYPELTKLVIKFEAKM